MSNNENNNINNISNLNKLYNNFNIINYNEITRNIEHWNPYEEFIDISFFKGKNRYFILGPENSDNLKYLWKFNIKYNSNENELKLYSGKEKKNSNNSLFSNPCINISIKNNTGKIDYINKCGKYNGRELINWMLEIMQKLNCNKCLLIDFAEKKCNKQSNPNYVPLSLIHKLWKGKTYYEYFGFIPYNINNNTFQTSKLLELNENMKKLKSLKWNDFNIDNEKWNSFKNKYNIIYDSPFLSFKEFTEEDCSIFYDILFYLDKFDQPSSEILNDIKKIISKSIWMKIL